MNSSTTVEPVQETDATSSAKDGHRFTRRSFLKLSAAAAGGLALYSGEIARHEISVEQPTIHLDRLPDAFRGLRIVQISDIHYGEFTESFFLRDVVDRVNRLQPDMVLVTGDFITRLTGAHRFAAVHRLIARHMVECAAILSEIACPLRFASLGNHDEDFGTEYVMEVLGQHGFPVPRNRAVPLERGNQRLWLAGLGSACGGDVDPAAAVPRASVDGNEPVILMAHEPDTLPRMARYNVDLMLSGHTHGGQVRLPFLPPLVLPPYGRHYVEGLFRRGKTQLYVNRGIGTIELPFRLFCPPEITVLTLA